MMVIRPVEPGDLPGLLKLAAETGGGLCFRTVAVSLR